MAVCDPQVHGRFRPLADEDDLIAGRLEDLRIKGDVLFKVHRGPYSGLGAAWGEFFRRFNDQQEWVVAGPCGDLYVCNPAVHQEDGFREVLTVLFCPVRRKGGGRKPPVETARKGRAKAPARPKAPAKRPARKDAAARRKRS